MSSHASTGSDQLFRLWAWFEDNLKIIIIGTGIFAVAFFFFSYHSYSRKQKEITAGQALSKVLITGGASQPVDAYLKIAGEYPSTLAGQRALLQASAALFTTGKYPEAQTQFQNFLDKYPDSPLTPQALLGVAASLSAAGKTDLAVSAYQRAADQTDNASVTASAKFAIARTYAAQGKTAEALRLYEEIARAYQGTSMANEAGVRAMELKVKTPGTPAAVTPAAAPAAPFTLTK